MKMNEVHKAKRLESNFNIKDKLSNINITLFTTQNVQIRNANHTILVKPGVWNQQKRVSTQWKRQEMTYFLLQPENEAQES